MDPDQVFYVFSTSNFPVIRQKKKKKLISSFSTLFSLFFFSSYLCRGSSSVLYAVDLQIQSCPHFLRNLITLGSS